MNSRKEIAGIIIEPVPANNGLLLQEEGFLHEVARLAKGAGSLLIFDEVITGFRVAFGGMAERTGIRPDLVTYGKIIGGGFPVGAYGGRADLMDMIAPTGPVYQAGTLSANPVAMTAGIVNLLKLKRENPYQQLERQTEEFALAMEALTQELGFPAHVQRFASLFWCVLDESTPSQKVVRAPTETPALHKQKYAMLFHSLLDKGIYLAPSAFEVSFMSTAHRKHHQDQFLDAMKKAILEIRAG